jgi:serine/threonine-protein kinase
VGILLWELLAGRRLYRTQGDVPLLEQARRAEVPELPTRDIPGFAGLAAIVTRALARDRDARYESAAAFREALEAWSDEHRVVPSAIRFGQWLVESFGRSAADRRRQRELLLTPSGHMPISPPSRSLSLPGEDGVAPRELPLPGIPSNVEVGFAAEVSPSAQEPASAGDNLQNTHDAGEVRSPEGAAPPSGSSPAAHVASPQVGDAEPVPKPRRAPLVRAVIPSPGAMRVFKELAKSSPEEPPLSPSIEILGVPPDKADEKERSEIRRTWVLVGAGIVVLIVAAYFALLRG